MKPDDGNLAVIIRLYETHWLKPLFFHHERLNCLYQQRPFSRLVPQKYDCPSQYTASSGYFSGLVFAKALRKSA